jgi:hypothetical protein
MKNIALISCLVALCFTSCIDDKSVYGGKEIDQISIAGSDSTQMQIISVDLGNECVITPVITAKNADSIKYSWSIGTYANSTKGNLKYVSNEKTLKYFFTEGGTYYAHLNATNGETGDCIDYQINVNNTFEEGIVISSNDESGNGNIGFIKTLTAEEITAGKQLSVMEHCLSRMNAGIYMKNLLGASRISLNYKGTSSKMIVCLADRYYFIDQKTFELIQEEKFSSVYAGFKGKNFFIEDSYISYPHAYDPVLGKYCFIDKSYQFAYENSAKFYTQTFDDIYPTYSIQARYKYANPLYIYVKRSNSSINEYSPYSDNQFLNTSSTGDLFKDLDILSAFKLKSSGDATYVVATAKADPLHFYLLHLTTKWTGTYGIDYHQIYNKPDTLANYELTDSKAVPVQGTRLIDNYKYSQVIYAKGNSIYVFYAYNASPTLPTTPLLSFGNDQITFADMNDKTSELYVGTYNATTKRGSVYVYDATNLKSDSQPKLYFKDCVDKIVDIRYKSK